MIAGRVFFSGVWRACCECGWCASFSYMENACAELARHIIKEHRTFTFRIAALSTDET